MLFSIYIKCQSFTYSRWCLNEVVTFEDVENYVQDEKKIIEKSKEYNRIKFIDKNNTTVTLSFKKNTQILECIIINDLEDNKMINQIIKSIFDQLGTPIYGYEKKKNYYQKTEPDIIAYIAYNRNYMFVKDNQYYEFNFYDRDYCKTINGPYKYKPIYTFAVCCGELKYKKIPMRYPSIIDEETQSIIIKSEIIKKW